MICSDYKMSSFSYYKTFRHLRNIFSSTPQMKEDFYNALFPSEYLIPQYFIFNPTSDNILFSLHNDALLMVL